MVPEAVSQRIAADLVRGGGSTYPSCRLAFHEVSVLSTSKERGKHGGLKSLSALHLKPLQNFTCPRTIWNNALLLMDRYLEQNKWHMKVSP